MLPKDLDLYKATIVGGLAFVASFFVENLELIADSSLFLGRMLTAAAMMATALYAFYKIHKNIQNERIKRKSEQRKD